MYDKKYVINALLTYSHNKSFKKTSKMLNISRGSIRNWKKQHSLFGIDFFDINTKINKHKPKIIITNVDKIIIYNIINEHPLALQIDLQILIEQKTGIYLSLKYISKFIKNNNYSYKKPCYRIVKDQKYLNELIEERKAHIEYMKKISISKVISIDEAGFSASIRKQKGLSPIGKQINMPISALHETKTNLIMAITINSIIDYETTEKSINGDFYYNFIKNMLNKLPENGYTLIFDNVNFHKSKKVLELITNSKNFYKFVPKYSPNNNPIENVFGILKGYYKNINNQIEKDTQEMSKERVNKVIDILVINYDKRITNIFNRSLTYDYINMENELRDRIIFRESTKIL